MRLAILGVSGLVGVGLVASSASADITFLANYVDGATEGFNDPTLGGQRKAAFEFALDIWGGQFSSSFAGETITVNAAFDNLGSGVLGGAGPTTFGNDGSTYYGIALANHLSGSDLNGANGEISATFNSSFSDWYYGTDGNTPFTQWDFVSVVLHEVAHGLNFLDLIESNGSWSGGQPGIYDRFLENGAGLALTAMTDTQRAAAIRSGDLWWNGELGVGGNGGVRPEMYAPSTYQSGSSVSHLDSTTHTGLLMAPGIFNGDSNHSLTDMELGMFLDMGWTPIPEPASVSALGLAGLLLLRRRRAA